MQLTVSELAGLVSKDTGLPKALLAGQIRHWSQHGLFKGLKSRGKGVTAAKLYEAHHLVQARILAELASLGLDIEQLASVSACMDHLPGEVRSSSGTWSGLQAVTTAIQAGEDDWYFNISVASGKLASDIRKIHGQKRSTSRKVIGAGFDKKPSSRPSLTATTSFPPFKEC